MKYLLPLFLLIGCHNPPKEAEDCWHGKPDQCVAQHIVWNESFGLPEDVGAPLVDWLQGIPCPGQEEKGPAYIYEGKCVGGVFFAEDWYAKVVDRGPISHTSYTHEFFHAFLLIVTGSTDHNHVRSEWRSCSTANNNPGCGFVDSINGKLDNLGL